MPCFMMATRLRSHPLQAQCEGAGSTAKLSVSGEPYGTCNEKRVTDPTVTLFLRIEPIFFVLCRILFLGVFAQILFR